ncbi:MAG: type II toxin-antitoxin system HicA family toxin [Gemmataceae bacterium]|nr:type II toxin-antitoxin system HicA family toxin [Gemmataceae bacterium]
MKVREVIRLIEADGWYRIRSRSGHRQYKHASKRGSVTVPGRLSDSLAPKTLNSILNQAGLS